MTSRRFDRAVPDAAERGAAWRADVTGPAPKHAAQHDATARIWPSVATAPAPRAQAAALARAGQALLQLQRQRGNRYVQQVADHVHQAATPPPVLQAKLVLGPPVDWYEREADRVSRQVMQGATQPAATGVEGGRVMRMPGIQWAHSADVGVVDANVQQTVQGARGGGQPLPDHVRSSMEEALGADFGEVRLHTDARADQLARSLQARAFTTGRDIFFRRGQDNFSGSGRQVLAHELTHVVQQGGGSLQHPGTTAQRFPSAARMSNLIQRRMGFEFETTAQVRGKFQPPQGRKRGFWAFDDEKEFYRPAAGHWKIVPDTGRMEFVSDPLATLPELQAAAGGIEAFINGLQNVEREEDIRGTHPGTWTPARNDYTVHVGSGLDFDADVTSTDWYGQPQVSVGVLTERVARFLHRARTAHPLSGLKEQIERLPTAQAPPMPTKGPGEKLENLSQLMHSWNPTLLTIKWLSGASLTEVDDLVRGAHVAQPQLSQTDLDKLRGLWTVMKAYWTNLVKEKVPGSYRKTRLQALARTDFRSYYNNLSQNAKKAFRAARDTFAPGSDLRQAEMIAGTKITLRRWYTSIMRPEKGSTYTTEEGVARPVDLLSANQSPTDEEIARGTDKSMGQFPLDVTGGQPRAVFELRHMTPGARVPIRLMYDHVLKPIFNLVKNVER